MPFIALCPNCRQTRVQAPKRKRGQMHDCPKCKQTFALEPMDESALPVDYKLPPVEFDLDEAYRGQSVEDFATAQTLVQPPLPAPTREQTPSDVVPALPATPELDYTPEVSGPEPAQWLALASGGLFGLAMLATQFDYGRFIALPLLGLGILLGLLALANFDHFRKKWGFAAIGVNVLGLILVLLLPDWLRMGPWVPEGDPNAGPKPVLAVPRDGSTPAASEWVDLERALWRQDDVQVDVVLEAVKPKPPSKDVTLRLIVKVKNVGVARAIEISPPPEGVLPRLMLASGPAVPFRRYEAAEAAKVFPDKEAERVLVFDALPAKLEELRLELPGVLVGSADAVRFIIPVSRQPLPERKKP